LVYKTVGVTPAAVPDSDLEQSVCFALYSSMQATLQLYRDLLAPWGLTFQQVLLLVVLWEHDDVTPGELAAALHLDSSSVSGLLSRMEKADLVRRTHSVTDRRAVRVSATDKAMHIKAELEPVGRCVADAIELERSEAEALIGALHALRSRVSTFDTSAALAAATP